MRQVLSISLSDKDVKKVKSIFKKRGFNSISDYFRYLIYFDDFDDNWISKKDLLKGIEEGRKEYERGETIVVKSASELYDY